MEISESGIYSLMQNQRSHIQDYFGVYIILGYIFIIYPRHIIESNTVQDLRETMKPLFQLFLSLALLVNIAHSSCHQCYKAKQNERCGQDPNGIDSYTLHMSVHPHLDAFWIFDFDSYYDPKPTQGAVHGYFASNRFHSVKQIFNTAATVLAESKRFRQENGTSSQKAHRSFMNSEMGFFKRWYFEQSDEKKKEVKSLLKTKYWQILGGGFVEHDEGCAYYDDIIENYQMGLHFLKQQFNYQPRAAVSADSFGHSSTTLAILAHSGIEGFLVERSDQHLLLQNKTQFVWKAKSANGRYYGALPTHVRWAIHGFQDQFIQGVSSPDEVCSTKSHYIDNLNRENQFLKRILKSNHIMRYFGHDFQEFDGRAYNVIEGMMEQFARQKCYRVTAQYGNPTQYFMTLMGQVFSKTKNVTTRTQDMFPIWDYDSGLYWTGYYTTDPFHKKNYRDVGRFLHAVRKAFLPLYLSDPNSQSHKKQYKVLEELAETVTYLQHHDGISGTSKYEVMDEYEELAERQMKEVKRSTLLEVFKQQFPVETNNPTTIQCSLEGQCTVPQDSKGDIYVKIFNSAGVSSHEPIIIHISQDQYYQPDVDYYEINCLCVSFPCPCSIYIFTRLGAYSLIKLKKVDQRPKDANLLQLLYSSASGAINEDKGIKYNSTHLTLIFKKKQYLIGYKRLNGDPTQRSYDHLSRYGDQGRRSFTIRSGKYALGNNVKTEASLSKIVKVLRLESDYLKKYVIIWAREQMKTVITITNEKLNQFKVETFSAAEIPKLEDLYLEVSAPHIENQNKFYTDSNGWLVMRRQLFKHEDYSAFFSPEGYDDIDGNSYPITAFCYIQNEKTGQDKLSVNTDRPQGMIAYHPGTIWINIDRLSADDGKWVYETTYRSQYQKFVHYITVENQDFNERRIQKLYDQPLLMQLNDVSPSARADRATTPEQDDQRTKWANITGLNKIKFLVKPWNDSSITLRVHNLDEKMTQNVALFTQQKICPFLTAFYGNVIKFDRIIEMSLGGNMEYDQFIKDKWNWKQTVDLSSQNEIFNKVFSETISLRPLEIRTFKLTNLVVSQQCKKLDELHYDNIVINYTLDSSKPMPLRTSTSNEKRIIDYMLNGDHCSISTPVLQIIKNDSFRDLAATDYHLIIDSTGQNLKPIIVSPSDANKAVKNNTKRPSQDKDSVTSTLEIEGIVDKMLKGESLTKEQKQRYIIQQPSYFDKKLKLIVQVMSPSNQSP